MGKILTLQEQVVQTMKPLGGMYGCHVEPAGWNRSPSTLQPRALLPPEGAECRFFVLSSKKIEFAYIRSNPSSSR